MRPPRELTSAVAALLGACAYLLLVWLVLGEDMNPFKPNWPWQLAFEHGELELDHVAHVLAILLAALPVGVGVALAKLERGATAAWCIGLIVSGIYLASPQPFYAEDQTWLLEYSVQMEVVKLLVAPALWYVITRLVVSLISANRHAAT